MKNPFTPASLTGSGKTLCALIAALIVPGLPCAALIPSPEKLLPDDTLVMLTVPDFAKIRQIYASSPQIQLWNDPAMKPFKDKFLSKLKEELLQPLERDLGVSVSDYANLPQGQVTVALTQNGWQGSGTPPPSFLLLLDAKDQSALLQTNLARLKKKWRDDGKPMRTEKIRDIEFSILPVSEQDVPSALSKLLSPQGGDASNDEPTNDAPKSELVIGQYDSLLLVANSRKTLEKVAAHLTGSDMPAVGSLPAYESCRVAMFRDSPFYGWANVKLFMDLLTRKPADKSADASNPFAAMDLGKILTATGLAGLRTLAFNLQNSSEGALAQFSLGVSESSRQGLFKMLPGEAKDSAPPPFVPADVVKFQRWRLDGQKAWTTLQGVLNDISPQLMSTLNFVLDTASAAQKEKDPNFDIRKNLFGNLGDDMISYEKSPPGSALADLRSPPSLFLLGSPHPDQLAAALKSLLVLMNRQGGEPTEREFLGRKIYSLPAPASPLPAADPSKSAGGTLSYAANGSYVAITTDPATLEEYLRSSNSQQKALRETPGLLDAIGKVGGSSTGLFGYENQAATTRAYFEALRTSPPSDTSPAMLAPGIPAFVPQSAFKEWVDFSLLPPFDKIAKYFYFTVYACSANVDGLTFKIFSPMPPQLRQ